MVRIRLTLRGLEPGAPYYRPEDRSGSLHHIPLLRLHVNLAILPPGADPGHRPEALQAGWFPRAVLDTGAPLTVFPFPVWQPFAASIQWLGQPPAPADRVRRLTILGGRFAYRLGRIRVGAVDANGGWLPASWVNAWFLSDDDPAAPGEAVLGLRCRLLERRRLRHEYDPAGPFGSAWWLEDA